MLISFKVANFRSFREEQELSLVASNYEKELSSNVVYPELPGLKGVGLLRGAAIYGANASGKSNLLAAFRFLSDFVVNSAVSQMPAAPITVEPYRLDDDSKRQPTRFELDFVVNNCRYRYLLEVTRQQIIRESLQAFPKGRARLWYSRNYSTEQDLEVWEIGSGGIKVDEALRTRTRGNVAYLSVAAQFNDPHLTPVYQWFLRIQSHLGGHLSGYQEGIRTFRETLNALERDRALLDTTIQLLQSADFGIKGIKLEREEHEYSMAMRMVLQGVSEDERAEYFPSLVKVAYLRRTHDGREVEFGNSEESEGTKRFLALLGPFLRMSKESGVIWIDEIESSLHPLLVRELIRMVFRANGVDSCPQLIFTTHNPLLLDRGLLRRDQVWFTEKDEDGATCLYPLTDYMPRKDESIMKGYLAGRYGGVPFIPEGLIQ